MKINATISADKKSITIVDQTDWTSEIGSLDSLISIVLYFYTSTTDLAIYSYDLISEEVDYYTANGEITLTFETLFGREYALDNWYNVKMTANDNVYESNYAGFLSDSYITTKVYENVNDLYTPEAYKKSIEPIAMQVMYLESMKYIGNSTITDRDIKATKRLNVLNRYNS